ncbi:OB-fold nucleic acid binding domain-containing protein [Paenibacillus sp. JJ-223]|uniref:OB-fold nucleic acid binding domain-containing protein n=1 Tax=Paenibacillus sp. JJ-223 TaxID=2905647 RepID=UPI001F42FB3D|nr:OB-fold nucleic acid binding domain-containing protein [Paenibacillus sp. JJ-223]CAH1223464.1 hypothetical protein PAECIP111890_05533 [Paenibacillus sp. JJ-223]
MERFYSLLMRKSLRFPLEYVSCLVITIISMYYVLQINDFDMSLPYIYSGDGLSTSLFIKGMIENGWYNTNPSVGAPFGLEMYDYPLGGDNFQYLVMKVLSLFNSDYIWVMNMYYFLTFPLCMLASFAVFRQLNVNYFFSMSFSLLYTFLPYHIIRVGHLFLLGYYAVPLIIMVMIWIVKHPDFLFVKGEHTQKRFNYHLNLNLKFIAALVICILIGSTGAYYAFFSCFFLLIIGLIQVFTEKKSINLLKSMLLIFLIAGTLLCNVSPSIVYKLSHSQDGSISSARNFEAAEVYGLKVVQLLLPTTNHNVEWIKEKKDEYNSKAPLVNENDTASLGLIGSVGFIFLLFILLFKKRSNNELEKINRSLSIMNISAILLGTIGGFGVLFAALVSAQIRSYNRLSIYIAFFSLLALALNMDIWTKKKLKKSRIAWIVAVSLLISLVGIYDQSTHPLQSKEVIASGYNNDAAFVERISDIMPKESMIFQIPYVSFPEGESLNNMGNYDLLKGYIHSSDLKWSFGSMKNSYADRWMKELVQQPVKEALNILVHTGYTGIYIDRTGYSSDYDKKLESEILNILQITPIESDNKMLAFYDLRDYSDKLKGTVNEQEWNKKKEEFTSKIPYGTEVKITGEENWELVQSKEGYRIVQTSDLTNLPQDQLSLSLKGPDGAFLTFEDEFSGPNKYSFRHWEVPEHFVISISNSSTGWSDNYSPTSEDISQFFKTNNYVLYYNTTSEDQISFKEQ